jgi:hypothetical protein
VDREVQCQTSIRSQQLEKRRHELKQQTTEIGESGQEIASKTPGGGSAIPSGAHPFMREESQDHVHSGCSGIAAAS